MSLYLAVWYNLTFSIIRAEDKEHAVHLLDQLGPPNAAKITEYDGPLFLDFRWKLKEDVHAEHPFSEVRSCGSEVVGLHENVLEFGFPNFYSYYQAVSEGEKRPSLEEAKAALKLDKDTFPGQPSSGKVNCEAEHVMDIVQGASAD